MADKIATFILVIGVQKSAREHILIWSISLLTPAACYLLVTVKVGE